MNKVILYDVSVILGKSVFSKNVKICERFFNLKKFLSIAKEFVLEWYRLHMKNVLSTHSVLVYEYIQEWTL